MREFDWTWDFVKVAPQSMSPCIYNITKLMNIKIQKNGYMWN